MEQKPVTIKEIAKRLNVSIPTVSRALNNHPNIGLRTKMRVQKLAKELMENHTLLTYTFKLQIKYLVIRITQAEFFGLAKFFSSHQLDNSEQN